MNARSARTPPWPGRAPASARGIALILVVWLLLAFTAALAGFAVMAHTEGVLARQQRISAEGRQLVHAGIEIAALRLMDPNPDRRWVADGREYQVAFEGADLRLRVTAETGKLDLNLVDADTLRRLFEQNGVEPDRAMALAGAVLDWRDPDDLVGPQGAERPQYLAAGLDYGPRNAPFLTVDELRRVLGMDHATYAAVASSLTVHAGAAPEPWLAGPDVLIAMGIAPEFVDAFLAAREAWSPGLGAPPPGPDGRAVAAPPGAGTYSIDSRLELAGGRGVAGRAVIRVRADAAPGQPYVLLHWREGEAY